MEATLTAGGTGTLKRFAVRDAWKKSLDAAGQSGAFAAVSAAVTCDEVGGGGGSDEEAEAEAEEDEAEGGSAPRKRAKTGGPRGKAPAAPPRAAKGKGISRASKGKQQANATAEDDVEDDGAEEVEEQDEEEEEPRYKSLNKVLRNKGDPEAVRQARAILTMGCTKALLWLDFG